MRAVKDLDSPEAVAAVHQQAEALTQLGARLAQFPDVRRRLFAAAPTITAFVDNAALLGADRELQVQTLVPGSVVRDPNTDRTLWVESRRTTERGARIELLGVDLNTGGALQEEVNWNTTFVGGPPHSHATKVQNQLREFTERSVDDAATTVHVRAYQNERRVLVVIGQPTRDTDNNTINNNSAASVAEQLHARFSQRHPEVTVLSYDPSRRDSPFEDITPASDTQRVAPNRAAVLDFTGDRAFLVDPPPEQYTHQAIARGNEFTKVPRLAF